MVGYVSFGIANAIRKWDKLQDANVIPVFAVDGETAVVNTSLPAIAIHVYGTDGNGNVFIGNGIRFYFELNLHYVSPIINYTFSKDNDTQMKMLDLSEEVIRCVEQSTELNDLKVKHDMVLQFDRMETYQTYTTGNSNSILVDVHRIIYTGSVEFVPYPDGVTDEVLLKKIILNNTVNETIIE